MRKHDNGLGVKRDSCEVGDFHPLGKISQVRALPFGSRHRTCEVMGASDDLRHFPVSCAMVLSPKALPLLLPGLEQRSGLGPEGGHCASRYWR